MTYLLCALIADHVTLRQDALQKVSILQKKWPYFFNFSQFAGRLRRIVLA